MNNTNKATKTLFKRHTTKNTNFVSKQVELCYLFLTNTQINQLNEGINYS